MDWTEGLQPEQLQIVTEKGWKGPGDALKSYAELEKLVGTDRFSVPGKDATDDDWGKIYDAFGRPKDPAGYEFKSPDDAQQIDYDAKLADWFRHAAHRTGMSARQAAAFHDQFVEMRRNEVKAAIEKVKADDAAMMAAFEAKHGDKAAARKEMALMAMKALGSPEFAEYLTKSGLGTDPRMIDTFASIAEKIGEDALKGDGRGLGIGSMTKEEAQAALTKLRAEVASNPKHPLMDKLHPDHPAAVNQWEQIHKALHGATPVTGVAA